MIAVAIRSGEVDVLTSLLQWVRDRHVTGALCNAS